MTRRSPPIDVFVSYKREDRETAQALAEALALRGYSVWWDLDLSPGGAGRLVHDGLARG